MDIIRKLDDLIFNHNEHHTLNCSLTFDGDSTTWKCTLEVIHYNSGDVVAEFTSHGKSRAADSTLGDVGPDYPFREALFAMSSSTGYEHVVGPTITKWLAKNNKAE